MIASTESRDCERVYSGAINIIGSFSATLWRFRLG